MQGPPPPTSSPPLAPPIKKQRGDGAAAVDPAQERASQLQALRQGFLNRPRMGPPPARRTMPSVGFRPRGTTATGNGTTASSSHNSNNNYGKSNGVPPSQAPPPVVPPPEPNNFARKSDIFPQAPKAEVPAVARRLDVAFHHQEPTVAPDEPPVPTTTEDAEVTAPVPPPPQPPTDIRDERTNAAIASTARTAIADAGAPPPKGVTFAETTHVSASSPPYKGHSMISSPEPIVTPPPRTPGPAGYTPFPGKGVSDHNNTAATPASAKYETDDGNTTAGATPYASNKSAQFPGLTPHPRTAKFTQMRDIADTPPSAKTNRNAHTSPPSSKTAEAKESAELRMQKQLAQETKKNAQLHRKVAELEDMLTEEKTKAVTFMSPPAAPMGSPSPSRRRPLDHLTPPRRRLPVTPHPKYGQPADTIDRAFLEQASEEMAYIFVAGPADRDGEDTDDELGVSAVFTVRRPYGHASMDQELWFAAGEANAKMYAQTASVDNVGSIEVAVKISADYSVLLLYNGTNVRHQNSLDGKWTKYEDFLGQGIPLGTVAYIDGDANEKEYSLDKLVYHAIDVRDHYCTSLRALASSLQRRGQQVPFSTPQVDGPSSSAGTPTASTPPPPPVDSPPAAASSTAVQAAEASPPLPPMTTPTPKPAIHEPQSDVFSLLIGIISSVVVSILKLPFYVVYTLVTWSLTAVLACILYLVLLHTMETTGVAPPLFYYHNPPGVAF